jgi:hypothetical protein
VLVFAGCGASARDVEGSAADVEWARLAAEWLAGEWLAGEWLAREWPVAEWLAGEWPTADRRPGDVLAAVGLAAGEALGCGLAVELAEDGSASRQKWASRATPPVRSTALRVAFPVSTCHPSDDRRRRPARPIAYRT